MRLNTTGPLSISLLCIALVGLVATLLAPKPAEAQVPLSSSYSQNFDTLSGSGGSNPWVNDSTIVGWYSNRTTYAASGGSSGTGSLYSFSGGSDKALGSIVSNATGAIQYGVLLQNNSGTTITSLDVSYTGEQWRNGGNPNQQQLDFAYKVASTILVTDTDFVDFNALDFVSPITSTSTTGVALNGNLAANRVALSATITGLNIPVGGTFMLRWSDVNDSGNDHGLAIDDLTISVPGAATATSTGTATQTGTATATGTATTTNTATATETATSTATETATSTATETATSTATETATATATTTSTTGATATNTATATETGTPTNTATATETGTPTNTATNTATATETGTATNTPTATETGTATNTATNTATATVTGTATNTATATTTSTTGATATNTATTTTTSTTGATATNTATATRTATATTTATMQPTGNRQLWLPLVVKAIATSARANR